MSTVPTVAPKRNLLVVLFLLAGLTRAAWADVLVDVKVSFPNGDRLKAPTAGKRVRFNVPGPGVVTTKVWATPYQDAGFSRAYSVLWNPGQTPFCPLEFDRSGRFMTYQNGKYVAKPVVGVPVYYEKQNPVTRSYRNVEACVVPPNHNYGGLYTQWRQEVRFVVEFTPSRK